jgi:hypothetical protein
VLVTEILAVAKENGWKTVGVSQVIKLERFFEKAVSLSKILRD